MKTYHIKHKSNLLAVSALFLIMAFTIRPSFDEAGLKDAFEGKFVIGAALNGNQINGRDEASISLLKSHFNSIVAENVMKSGLIQPRKGEFNFSDAVYSLRIGK